MGLYACWSEYGDFQRLIHWVVTMFVKIDAMFKIIS